MDRDCNRCIWATRDGDCASWDCDFIAKRDAANAYKASRWIPYHGEALPSGSYLVTLVTTGRVTFVGHADGMWIGCSADNVSAYMPAPAPYSKEV